MTWRRQDWFYGGGLLVTVVVLGSLMPDTASRVPTGQTSAPVTSAPAPKSYYLSSPNHADMLVCASPHVLAEFAKIANHNDTYGLIQLVAPGQAFQVTDGVPVLVLDTGFAGTQVRILSGSRAGSSGYVNAEFVHER